MCICICVYAFTLRGKDTLLQYYKKGKGREKLLKDTETKLAFIKARAEGKSYSTISKELGIAKATCTSWEHALREEIDTLKRAQTEELYTAYNMKRDARIKALGEIIQKIDKALEDKPLEDLAPDKLLDLRLKYTRELNKEYLEPTEIDTDNTLDGLLEQYNQLYIDSKRGKYSPADIKAQLAILDGKRDLLYQLTGEQTKEEKNLFDIDIDYTSKLLRHEEEAREEA